MESRTKVLTSLVSLIAITTIAAMVGIYRIAILSTDLDEFREFDLPLENGAVSLGRFASQRTELIGISIEHVFDVNRKGFRGILFAESALLHGFLHPGSHLLKSRPARKSPGRSRSSMHPVLIAVRPQTCGATVTSPPLHFGVST